MWIKNVVMGFLLAALSACSTTSYLSEPSPGVPSHYSDRIHQSNKSSDDAVVRKVVSLPFKTAGVVALGMGALIMKMSANNSSYDPGSDGSRDAGLFLSGLGVAAAGVVLTKLGDAISE